MATSSEFPTSNTYIKYRIIVDESSTDTINNKSTIRVRVQARRTNSEYTTNYAGNCYVKVDSSSMSSSWAYNDHPIRNSWVTLFDRSTDVTHDDDGTKTTNVQAYFKLTSGGTTKVSSSYHGFDVELISLDRQPPVVSITASNIDVNEFGITLNASGENNTCDSWEYSIDNGINWVEFSTTSGTSASVTVTNLLPNTTYNTIGRARKVNNQVKGSSQVLPIKTIGNAVLNSASDITADASTVQILFNCTVYVPSYAHKLELKKGDTVLLTFNNIQINDGNNSITLTAQQKQTILNAMDNVKAFNGTLALTTYDGNTQIGYVSTLTVLVQTTSASAPTFNDFVYFDSNAVSSSVTEDNQIFIQNVSILSVTADVAVAKNGATITGYSVSAGSTTKQSVSNVIGACGVINASGTIALTVTAIDSRGYSTSVTKNITVLPYEKIKVDSYVVRRVNEVEDDIEVELNGTISQVLINDVNKNNEVKAWYRYRKTSEQSPDPWNWIPMTNPSPTLSGSSFSYSNISLAEMPSDFSYYIEFWIQDKGLNGQAQQLSYETLQVIVPQGIPLMAYRSKKVGINKREPTKALDVVGDSAVSGEMSIGGAASVGGNLTITGSLSAGSVSNAIKSAILNAAYPIGSIYMSVSDTDPGTLFGGTWEALENRFLVGAGDEYQVNATGGEAEHTLSIDEMPEHYHEVIPAYGSSLSGNSNNHQKLLGGAATSGWATDAQDDDTSGNHTIQPKGGGQPHNNLPPYLAVYMWKRTA